MASVWSRGSEPATVLSCTMTRSWAGSTGVEPPVGAVLRFRRARCSAVLDPLLRDDLLTVPLAAPQVEQPEPGVVLRRGVGRVGPLPRARPVECDLDGGHADLVEQLLVQEGADVVGVAAHLLTDDAGQQRGGAAAVVEPLAGVGGGVQRGRVAGGVVAAHHLVHLGALVEVPVVPRDAGGHVQHVAHGDRGAGVVGILVPLGDGGGLVDVEAAVAYEDADHGRGHGLGHGVARHDRTPRASRRQSWSCRRRSSRSSTSSTSSSAPARRRRRHHRCRSTRRRHRRRAARQTPAEHHDVDRARRSPGGSCRSKSDPEHDRPAKATGGVGGVGVVSPGGWRRTACVRARSRRRPSMPRTAT